MRLTQRQRKSKGKTTTPPKKNPSQPSSHPNSKQKRIPRPAGITMLIREYHKTNNKALLTKASQLLIDQWSSANFTLEGEIRSIDWVASFVGMPVARVIQRMTKPMQNWLSQEKVEDRFEALLGFVIKNGLATRSQTQKHLALLTEGQRDTKTGELSYTPFVSPAVTQALNLLHVSDINLLKMIEQLKPSRPTTAIQINNADQRNPQTPNGQFIGINEAVKLLNEKAPIGLLDSPDLQAKLLAQNNQDGLPEIIATRQQGLSIDGSAKPIPKRTHHTDRREDDGPIYQDVIIP